MKLIPALILLASTLAATAQTLPVPHPHSTYPPPTCNFNDSACICRTTGLC